MKSEISFSLNGLALKGRQPEERLLLGQVAQTEGCATLLGDVRTNQIPDQLDYAHLGGCPVPLRSSLVRVVLFNIAATGIIAALVALASDSKNVWFPCALSAAVNGVAAVHYMLIWKIRAQNMPVPHMHMAHGHEPDGSFVGNKTPSEQKEMELAKMFTQELSVDGLRYTDWAVTLPLMTLELYDLVANATGGAENYPIESKYVAAALMPVMVGLGSMHRFFANEVRGGKAGMASQGRKALGYGSFIASCVLFSIVVASILDPLRTDKCPSGVPATQADGTCPIVDGNLKNERTAVYILTLTWIGYPAVVFATSLAQCSVWICNTPYRKSTLPALSPKEPCPEHPPTRTDGYISSFKDVSYGCLDVVSKGGLAIYCAYRCAWVTG